MTDFDRELEDRLADIREQGLHRELRRVDSPQGPRIELAGRTLINFSSNDYLGLANHPALKEAAIRAVETFGSGSGASRLICGSLTPHHELEQALAAFKGTEAALSFSSGYATAIGTICALLSKDDIIITDKLVHACVVDAARLCGAKIRIFAHNDLNSLKDILKWADKTRTANCESHSKAPQILIVTESVFSMDGDHAPLTDIVALKEAYGAWLMVDEAHATGLYGANRRGLAEQLAVSDLIEIQMGTLGKALGASGGYICGSRALIDFLINRARSFVFSTAPMPSAAAAATAAIELLQTTTGVALHQTLWSRLKAIQALNRAIWFRNSVILPVLVGDEDRAMAVSAQLREEGFFVPAIRYPTVARQAARLRVTLTAAHTETDVVDLAKRLEPVAAQQSGLRDA